MQIQHGITGNRYVLGTEAEVKYVCRNIDKSESSACYVERYGCWCARIKAKRHKRKLDNFTKENGYGSDDFFKQQSNK